MDQPGTKPEASKARTDYRYLHKYLRDRYAQVVVLRFAEIEDLLGSALPEAARLQPGWWTDAEADGTASPQSQAWVPARRTASPNLPARTVTFERLPD